MPTASEMELPLPLTDVEIKNGIAFKISQAIREHLDKVGRLYGRSYPKFSATYTVAYRLDDFGLITEGQVTGGLGDEGVNGREEVIGGAIPETPPNVFRSETDQPIPVQTIEKGRSAEKKIHYQQRKNRYAE